MEARDNDLGPLIWAKANEGKSHAVIAQEFNATRVVPPRDKPWTKHSISRIAQATRNFRPRASEASPTLRQGCSQAKVRAKVSEASELLIDLWRQGRSYKEISSALAAAGIQAPWGGHWGATSIHSYLLRALNARSLREARGSLQ